MTQNISITPALSRAARALLDLTQVDLARRANLSRQTVNDFESGKRMPIPNNIAAMLRAFLDNGVEFPHPEEGVRATLVWRGK